MKRALRLALLSTGLVAATTVPATATVSFDARVKAQRAIEEVYWRHRVWPSQNTMPKPALDVLMPADAITVKVERYLKQSWAVERIWHRPITRRRRRGSA